MSDTAPTLGVMETLEPGLRRILCPNPSPMTYWGTNSFVIGEGDVAVVDPGPAIPAHMEAILGGLEPGERVSKILVTHSHLDHSPLSRALSEATGAPIFAYGDSLAGRSDVMNALVAGGYVSGGEGVDAEFAPDEVLADGELIEAGGVRVEALWTPGHFCNHLSFAMGNAVLVGDLVMAWSTSLVSPPDGDLTAFMTSCARMKARGDRIHYPAHGPAIMDPSGRLTWLIAHRLEREAQVMSALASGLTTIPEITQSLYTETPPPLIPMAQRNVFAHLIDLISKGQVTASPALSDTARFSVPKN